MSGRLRLGSSPYFLGILLGRVDYFGQVQADFPSVGKRKVSFSCQTERISDKLRIHPLDPVSTGGGRSKSDGPDSNTGD